jgi:hypothetical protein
MLWREQTPRNSDQQWRTIPLHSIMRLLALLLLATICCNAFAGGEQSEERKPTPFHKDNVYVYSYNSQICSGLIAQSDDDAAEPGQKSATRIQAQARIQFISDRHAQLQLQQIRIGQLNEQLAQPQKVQPMAVFEPVSQAEELIKC